MNINLVSFETAKYILDFELAKGSLRCRCRDTGSIAWIKRLKDIAGISSVSEDGERFFLACEIDDDIGGRFLALRKEDGNTAWFIAGKALLNIIYAGMLYLIFIDDTRRYFFIQVDASDGTVVWHHPVDKDLRDYSINKASVLLEYASGKTECLNARTGMPV